MLPIVATFKDSILQSLFSLLSPLLNLLDFLLELLFLLQLMELCLFDLLFSQALLSLLFLLQLVILENLLFVRQFFFLLLPFLHFLDVVSLNLRL